MVDFLKCYKNPAFKRFHACPTRIRRRQAFLILFLIYYQPNVETEPNVFIQFGKVRRSMTAGKFCSPLIGTV